MKRNEVDGHSLDRALLKLLPDIFFHPVWTYFARPDAAIASDHLASLRHTAEELVNRGEVDAACQVWLCCAAQQGYAAEYLDALDSIEQTLSLAERYTLPRMTCWAAWGGSATCVRQGNFRQAAEYLQCLGDTLRRQSEWILADVIDLIQQSLPRQVAGSGQAEADAPPSRLDSNLRAAQEQLLHWGEPPTLPGGPVVTYWPSTARIGPNLRLARFAYHWRHFWQTVKRAIKGELRLEWVETAKSCPPHLLDASDERPAPPALLPPASPLDRGASAAPQLNDPPQSLEPPAPATPPQGASALTPTLMAYMLGTFQLIVNDVPATQVIGGKSRTILEYLLVHHDQPVSRDVLMDVFWPEAAPDSARNRLNVSLHHLRQALRSITSGPVILFQDGAYRLNPEFELWIDINEFDRHVRKGRQLEVSDRIEAAIKEYELARDVYKGDFLADEPYEDWPSVIRERLRADYLDTLERLSQIYFDRASYADCAALCQLILVSDNCREDAHCRLMQCYSRQNQRYLALRQYQVCAATLRTELEVDPAPSTIQLYERIRRRERI